jgi:hypothetical protein
MGCGASAEAALPVDNPAVEKNETANRTALGDERPHEPAPTSSPPSASRVPDSVKRASSSTSGLLERGYDDQFKHPLHLNAIPWKQQLENSASSLTN